jgi:hypothetical protein
MPSVPSFYFLEEAGPRYGSGAPGSGGVPGLDAGPYGYPGGLANVASGAYPLDSRLAGGEPPGQPAAVEKVPTGGAPSAVPGHETANHPLRVDTQPSPAIAGVGQG